MFAAAHLLPCAGLLSAFTHVPQIQAVRDIESKPENFPAYQFRNLRPVPVFVTIASSLESPDGTLRDFPPVAYQVAASETRTLAVVDASTPAELRGDIALLRSIITIEGQSPVTHAAIVGTPRPVSRDGDYFIAMNAHLSRCSAEEQWKMLRLMREAGVRSVRLETRFEAPDQNGVHAISPKIDETLLAAEAFGMNTLMAITYFPKSFYESSEKVRMAYECARSVAGRYKGRIYDYQYGNETNSGWGAFGAAADMAAHNQAMALGTLSVLPDARPATFGIAEADPNYLGELLRNGLAPYIRAVTVHPYCGVAEAGIAKLEANQRVIAAQDSARGPSALRTELWATEIGFHVDERGTLNPTTQQLTQVNGFTLDQQADQLARLFLLARAKGIDRIYWYNLYGKNDPETFWLLDADFRPRSAYHTLKFIAPLLNGSIPLGGTASTELVQQHLFRQPDGSVFLAAWALRDNVKVSLRLPSRDGDEENHYTVHDITGLDISGEIDLESPVMLGERAIIIRNMPKDTASFSSLDVQVNALDQRNWNAPMSRWETGAGTTIQVPYVVFNSGSRPITAHPAVIARMPGWKIELPEPVAVAPGETVTRHIALTAPANAVPGVEYRFSFAAELAGPRRTVPYEVRVWLDGQFPYAHLLSDAGGPPRHKVRRPIDEGRDGFGRSELTAYRRPVTVDGDLSEWQAEEFVTLDQGGSWKLRDVTHPLREDKYARAALRWDNQYLYAAFLVFDDDLSIPDLTSRDWRDSDNVRVFLSAEPDFARRAKNVTERDLLLFMTPTRQNHDEPPAVMAASIGGFLRENFGEQVRIASRVWQGGWLIEAAIPFASIGVMPHANLEIGCNLLSDDSDHGFRKSAHMTYLKNFNYWNDPRTLGVLRLMAE